MNIAFILNGPSKVPIGGHKIVFEYANALVSRGYNVNIYFDCDDGKNSYHIPKNLMFARRWIVGKYRINWFRIDKRVGLYPIKKITKKNVGANDIVITTAAIPALRTYETLNGHKNIINFVQGYENWCLPEEKLQEIYQKGKKNIIISQWLKDKIEEPAKSRVEYIPNGLDLSMWKEEKAIKERNPFTVAMLYSSLETKGSVYGLRAIQLAKKQLPELQVKLFGTTAKNENIPDWVQYYENATPKQVKDIYNQSVIFLNPSLGEGFGLTSIESMACGCMLITTDYDATKDYAKNMENAIVVPRKDYEKMAKAIVTAATNRSLSIRIAENGRRYVNEYFLWENSFRRFEQTLLECIRETK